ncbi:phosphate transport system permease protein PstA [Oxobacter pfennigii]|uniref:Phosphate transport system permease protein PstA n=1 Tax=Oxobacter pfennigii TaxID=36849 RepID=A0A0P9AF84_9CLOT|nr:phosphate ABC transporter permease PstA [Oxobacter pfennigii]KPU44019.1 phosphate transport system permease protein PstA [Oxobacter pfennigii]
MMKPQTAQKIAQVVLWTAALLTVLTLVFILGYIFMNGLHKINWEFLTQEPRRMGSEGGIFSTIVSTIIFTFVTLLFSVPIGIAAAIHLTEYTKKSWLTDLIRFGTEALSGIPSIVFGLFGFAFFVILLKPITGGWSLASGALTGACMILPTIIRTTEEAIKTVPLSYREASFAVGATKWQTISKVVIPTALPGIITGVILGIGRIVGETAALLLTLGGSLFIPTKLTDPLSTMSMHLYKVAMEVGAMDMAFGTATVLIVTVFIINSTANFIMSFMKNKTTA